MFALLAEQAVLAGPVERLVILLVGVLILIRIVILILISFRPNFVERLCLNSVQEFALGIVRPPGPLPPLRFNPIFSLTCESAWRPHGDLMPMPRLCQAPRTKITTLPLQIDLALQIARTLQIALMLQIASTLQIAWKLQIALTLQIAQRLQIALTRQIEQQASL